MSVYMTEEEQIEAIKKWWNKYSNLITIVISVILLAIAGSRYWTWHQGNITKQASNTYESMMVAYANQRMPEAQAFATTLLAQNGKTSYADAARLLLAKVKVENAQFEAARKLLEPVAAKASMPALQNVARARLARLFLADKQYNKALIELEQISESSFQPLVNELRGDIYTAKGEANKAIQYYQTAAKEARENNMANTFLEMKASDLVANQSQSGVSQSLVESA
jgi:predicted negative regulator of RcsB-dependent stress response